ncbi:hypothetical protein C0989_007061 [Termitomyces sp. Mn162]|nr:hypothetical protein C0989_007061 [Termitomyces sp. Mn162]
MESGNEPEDEEGLESDQDEEDIVAMDNPTVLPRKNKVVLDFEGNQVIVNGQATPAVRVALEDADRQLCQYWLTEKWQGLAKNLLYGGQFKPTVEDLVEEVQAVAGLPQDHPALLLLDKEYEDTLKRERIHGNAHGESE